MQRALLLAARGARSRLPPPLLSPGSPAPPLALRTFRAHVALALLPPSAAAAAAASSAATS